MIKMDGSDFITLGVQYGLKPYWEDDCWYLLLEDRKHYIAYCAEDDDKKIKFFVCAKDFKYIKDIDSVIANNIEIIKDDEEFVSSLKKALSLYKKAILQHKIDLNNEELEKIKKDFV